MTRMHTWKRRILTALVASLWAAMFLVGDARTFAAPVWREPMVVYSTAGYAGNPVLVADPSGDVHLLFMASAARDFDPSKPSSIWYTRLHQGVWTPAEDILATPNGPSADKEAAALDSRGFLHVIWAGFDGNGSELFYSRAHVSQAGSPLGWTSPIRISDTGLASGAFGQASSIAVSADDVIHIAYATLDRRIMYRHSTDGGKSWSAPATVADFTDGSMAPDDVRIAAAQNNLYVTCSTYALPSGWPPTGTFFVRSTNAGMAWQPAVRVASDNRALLTVAANGAGIVYRMWYSTADIGEHSGQFSSDAGQTWSPPQPVVPEVKGGLSGFGGMAFDSLGQLHVAIAGSTGKSAIWEDSWDGKQWGTAANISRGSVGSRSIEEPNLVISQGNQVHVTWEDDFQRIWYTSRLLDAPALPAAALPAAPTLTTVTSPTPPPPAPTPVVKPTLASVPDAATSGDHIQTASQALWPIFGSAAVIVILLGAIIVVRLRRLG